MDNSNPWNGKSSTEELEIEQAEHRLSDPSSANMQFLQSTLPNADSIPTQASVAGAPWAPPGKAPASGSPVGAGFSNLAPAYSGLGLLGAVGVSDLSSAASALGISSAVASAAPAAMGKTAVGDGAALAALGPKALAQGLLPERFTDSLPLMKALNDSAVPLSPEFEQLMAMLGQPGDLPLQDPLQSLILSAGSGGSESLQLAIDSVMDQISLIANTFEPLMDGFGNEVTAQTALMSTMSSADLGLNILTDAGNVGAALTDLLGSVDVIGNPQIGSLLNLGSALDDVVAVVDSLPILDGITNPITDIVGGITDPVTDIVGGITDPVTDIVGGITDPVTDIVGGITDPVTDIVGGITDPVTDIVGGITDPVTDVVGDLPGLGLLSGLGSSAGDQSDSGLLDALSSGISSSAGAEGGALDGVLGALDPNKG